MSNATIATRRKATQRDPSRLPLAHIRVLEMTNNWAGPLAGRHLADLGAEVIKIEPPDRPMTRRQHYPGLQPLKYHYNRSAYFNKMNRNKLGVTIDIDTPEGRDLFLDLVKSADVVLENNSPRVMSNLKVDYPVLRRVNPSIVMCSISAFGQTGPFRDFVAYGANIEASCGLAAATGYPDDPQPYRTSLYYPDPVTAVHAALAIMAALAYRERTGRGQYIDMALQENGAAFFPEALLEYSVTGRLAPRRGNRHPRYAPQGCYPSFGDDLWLALCVRSDDEWRRFCDVTGDARLRDPRFATVEDRRRHHDDIDALIAQWSRRFDHDERAAVLQRAGIPAAPVLANWEMVSNLHVHARGFYEPVAHREMGVFPYPGLPWRLSATPGGIRMASPCFGEHNQQVLGDLLGMDEDRLAALYAKRVVATEPPPTMTPLTSRRG